MEFTNVLLIGKYPRDIFLAAIYSCVHSISKPCNSFHVIKLMKKGKKRYGAVSCLILISWFYTILALAQRHN